MPSLRLPFADIAFLPGRARRMFIDSKGGALSLYWEETYPGCWFIEVNQAVLIYLTPFRWTWP